MSQFWQGNLFLALSMLTGASGQVMLKQYLRIVGPVDPSFSSLAGITEKGSGVLAASAAVLLIAGFGFWLASLTRLDLSYAYPIACGSAVIVAIFSALFLHEPLTLRTIVATMIIVAGTGLLVSGR